MVDVGGVYNHDQRRYDHHMTNPPTDQNGHIFSSAGLIWYHYGMAYLQAIGIPKDFEYKGFLSNLRSAVFKIINIRWIIPIDKWDNGVYQGPTPISEVVSAMLPIDPEKSKEKYDLMFDKCIQLVGTIFKRACFHAADVAIGRTTYIKADREYYFEKRVLYIDADVKEFGHFAGTDAHFIIYPTLDHTTQKTNFNIRPIYHPNTKVYKTGFPKDLYGLEESAILERGIEDILFIHHTGFLGKAKSKEQAIAFCKDLLEE